MANRDQLKHTHTHTHTHIQIKLSQCVLGFIELYQNLNHFLPGYWITREMKRDEMMYDLNNLVNNWKDLVKMEGGIQIYDEAMED